MDAASLKIYRKMALQRLEALLVALPEEAHEADLFVDKSIRTLSKLAPKPDGAPPYQGLYGAGSTFDEYRDIATDRLNELLDALPNLDPIDQDVDKYIRILSELPEKPADVEPYVRLFSLPTTPAEPAELKPHVPEKPSQQFVTSEQLIQIAGTSNFKSRIESLTPGVNATFEKYQINTKLRMAHFLGQVMHESGGFRYLREIWGPTDIQRRYEGRRDLGNTQPGDGKKFMGRGLIQLTGRHNYQKFTNELGKDFGVDFTVNPELVEQSPYAVMAAGWYWNGTNLNALADQDNLLKITRRINGGTLGLHDRELYVKRAKLVLK